PCVGAAVRSYKIALNDCHWSSNFARARGMRKLAIAQLGSDTINQAKFAELVRFKGIQRALPVILRSWADHAECKNKNEVRSAAKECQAAKNLGEAVGSAEKAYVSASAYASAYAYAYAYASAYTSAYAYAYASASAYAYASAYREYLDEKLGKDFLLNLSAQIALNALRELKSPGCKWLDL